MGFSALKFRMLLYSFSSSITHLFIVQQSVHLTHCLFCPRYLQFFISIKPHEACFIPSPTEHNQAEVHTFFYPCLIYSIMEIIFSSGSGSLHLSWQDTEEECHFTSLVVNRLEEQQGKFQEVYLG